MVEKFINFIVYKIYYFSRKFLIDRHCLVSKTDFDLFFWGGSV